MPYSEADRNYFNRAVRDVVAETEAEAERPERRSERQTLVTLAVYILRRIVELDRTTEEGEVL